MRNLHSHTNNFPFLATKDGYYTCECIYLLLTVIYDHVKYKNVHLQMSVHSLFWGGNSSTLFATLLEGGIALLFFATVLEGIHC